MADLENQLKTLIDQMKEKILSLPENENCTRISEHIVVVSYKDLINNNLSASMYNFKDQYKAIVRKIESCTSTPKQLQVLEDCVKNGFVEDADNKFKRTALHPTVIQHLKNEIQL